MFDIINENHKLPTAYLVWDRRTRVGHSHTQSLVILDRKQVTLGMVQHESRRQRGGQKVNQGPPLNQEEVVFLIPTKTNHKPGRCAKHRQHPLLCMWLIAPFIVTLPTALGVLIQIADLALYMYTYYSRKRGQDKNICVCL